MPRKIKSEVHMGPSTCMHDRSPKLLGAEAAQVVPKPLDRSWAVVKPNNMKTRAQLLVGEVDTPRPKRIVWIETQK